MRRLWFCALLSQFGRTSGDQVEELVEGLKELTVETNDHLGDYRCELQTCSGWKLNHLPKVRKFVKDKGQADYYPGLKINFINGRKPELVCFKAEDEVERIEMERMTTEECHELVRSKGYKRVMPVAFARRIEQGEEVPSEEWNEYLEALKKVERRIKDAAAEAKMRGEDKIDEMDAKFDAMEEKLDGMDTANAEKDEMQKKAGDLIDKVMADPELKAMVDENPKLQEILEEVKANPMAGMKYMMDPDVSPFLQKAMTKMGGDGGSGDGGMPDLSALMGGMPGGKGTKGRRRKKGKAGGGDPMMEAMMGMLGGLGGKGGGKGGMPDLSALMGGLGGKGGGKAGSKGGGKGGMPDLSAMMGGKGGKGGMPDLSALMGGLGGKGGGKGGMPDLSAMMGGKGGMPGMDGMDGLDGMFKELGGMLKELKEKGGPEAAELEGLDEELAELMEDFGDDDMGDLGGMGGMADLMGMMGGKGGDDADDEDSAEHTEL